MVKAIEISKVGGAEELKIIDKALRTLGPKDVLIRQTAIGVNHFDLHFRNGFIPLKKYPFTPGFEAVGIIEDVGSEVEATFEIGQRVAYATGPLGAYAEKRVIDSKFVVAVPAKISDSLAAGCLFKGMTAHYLLRRVFFVVDNNYVLIHGVTGGVGTLMSQWARFLKARVIGTVGSDEKKEQARKLGCHHVFNYNDPDLPKHVMDATKGKGISVLYDLIGAKTFDISMQLLSRFGVYVAVGDVSGTIPPFAIQNFSKQSYYYTAPSLFSYKANRMELILSAEEVFQMLIAKKIQMPIKEFAFDNVIEAHKAQESGKTYGSNILRL